MNAPDTTRTGSVYLTFDDGPDPEWTPRILDLLAQTGVHAAFFVVGEFARKEPTLLRRIAAEGHAIGNHTYSHRHPWFMSSKSARAQVRDGAQALSDVIGAAPRFYRPPHGRYRACMTDEAQRCGEKVVLWYTSANRDAAVFADPARFDIARAPNEHLAFGGGGVHYCLGANLARVEIRAIFEQLLTRVAIVEPTGAVERLPSLFINGPRHMPVRLTASGTR